MLPSPYAALGCCGDLSVTKAVRRVGVVSLWGDGEISVKLPAGAKKRRPLKISTPATHLAALIVQTYARFRMRAGLPVGDKNWRGELARAARTVAEDGWSAEVMLPAAAEFAETQTARRPAFFVEWVREKWESLAIAEHQLRQREPFTLSEDAQRAINWHTNPLMGKKRTGIASNGSGALHRVRCTGCGSVIFAGEGSAPHVCRGRIY